MSVGTARELQEIVDQVRDWSADSRLELARGIISTLNPGQYHASKSLRDLLGLMSVSGEAPDDAACRAIVEDALIEKHGR